MTKRAKRNVSRPVPRWFVIAGGLALVVAIVAAGAVWFHEPSLEPLPAVSLPTADREVSLILDKARQQVEQDRHSAMAWGDMGGVLRAHEFGPEAEVCFRNAQRLDPYDYRWPYLLAVSLAATDADQSLRNLRQAAELAGDRLHVHLRLADALLDRSLLDEASRVVERALQLAPSEPRALLAKARLLFAQGHLEESRQWCERSVAGAADKRAPRLLLAQLCRRLGDAEGAARETLALASIPEGVTEWEDPDVATVLALRRDRSWRLMAVDQMAAEGQAQEATGLLSEMARYDDPSGEATVMLVRALLAQQRHGEAEAALREKLTGHPESERLRFQLGIVLFALQKYDLAVSEFRRVTELKPDNIDAHYNLGHALRKAGQGDLALQAFAATVKLSPGHAFARANLAELLLDAGRVSEARPHLRIAARLAPADPKVRELLARLPPSQP